MLRNLLRIPALVLAVLLALFCLNLIAANLPASIYRQRIVEAVHSGGFAKRIPFPFGSSSGAEQPFRYNHNDCLILSMLASPAQGSPVQNAVSPLMPVGRARMPDGRVPPHEACSRMLLAASQSVQTEYYHRYVHGHWTLAGVLLPLMSFETLSLLLLLSSCSLALGVAAVALYRLAGRRSAAPARDAAFLGMGAAGPLLLSLNNYGRSLSFAPSDIVMFGFMLVTLLRPLSGLSDRSFLTAITLFGALTAAFEFLTGAIPAAIALLLGCLAFDPAADQRLLARRAIRGIFCFGLAVLLALLLKWLAVGVFWNGQEVASAAEKLAGWTRESRWTISLWAFPEIHQLWALGFPPQQVENSRILLFAFALLRLANESISMGFGSEWLGYFIIVAGPALLLVAGLIGVLRGGTGAHRIRGTFLMLAVAVMLGWHLLFVHHSILHAYFMQRPFAWLTLLLIGWVGWCIGKVRGLARRSPSPSKASALLPQEGRVKRGMRVQGERYFDLPSESLRLTFAHSRSCHGGSMARSCCLKGVSSTYLASAAIHRPYSSGPVKPRIRAV